MASRGRGAAQRGARFERAVVGWLRDQWGLRAERIRSGRSTDAGDIAWPDSDWLLDCKSQDRWSVLRWFAENLDACRVRCHVCGTRVYVGETAHDVEPGDDGAERFACAEHCDTCR